MLDQDLLSKFVRERSQEAFAEIVRRHIDTVYASARRQVRDAQLADDVTQAVFIVLMRKAKSLRPEVPLIGWLLKTTYFASRDALKAEMRRRKYEQRAAAMQNETQQTTIPDISPDLDIAIARLHELDRGIIAMRFLEDKSVAEIAEAIGVSRDAAAKRLTRAIGKLRGMLVKRGSVSAAVSTEVMLMAVPRMAAPPHLLGVSISAASGSSITAGSAIAKGAIKMMIWGHAKAAVVVLAGAALVGATAVGAHSLVRTQASAVRVVALAIPATTPAVPAPTRCIGKLNNGVSIEILGIADHDDATMLPTQWWNADGSDLEFPPYARISGELHIGGPFGISVVREVATRINPTVSGSTEPASIAWHVPNSFGSASSTPVDDKGKFIWNIYGTVIALADAKDGAMLHLDVASGPWSTLFSAPADQGNMTGKGLSTFMFSRGFETGRQTHVILAMTGLVDEAERVVAIDRTGKVIPSNSDRSQSNKDSSVSEYQIDLPLRQVKEFQFQTRSWNQWIEIRHIALHPDEKTALQIVTSDQPQAAPAK